MWFGTVAAASSAHKMASFYEDSVVLGQDAIGVSSMYVCV